MASTNDMNKEGEETVNKAIARVGKDTQRASITILRIDNVRVMTNSFSIKVKS